MEQTIDRRISYMGGIKLGIAVGHIDNPFGLRKGDFYGNEKNSKFP